MYSETSTFWNKIHECCSAYGIGLNSLDRVCGLQYGLSAFMCENDLYPPNEVLQRYILFSGLTEDELMGRTEPMTVEVPKYIPVVKGSGCINPYYNIESVLGRICIDVATNDRREYLGVLVEDDSMKDACIFEDDIAVVRRQAIANDGDIVVAKVEDRTVIRRYYRRKDVVWLKPEGLCEDDIVTEILSGLERKISILGKVIYTMRFFEEI